MTEATVGATVADRVRAAGAPGPPGDALCDQFAGQRTRTRSEVKWLANELAATAGEMERIDVELVRLRARKKQLQRVHRALSAVSAQLAVPDLPGLVPSVRARVRYNGRGNLRGWLRATLLAANPQAVSSAVLTEMAAVEFGLHFASSEQRSQFRRNALTRALRKLLVAGVVERLHDPGGLTGLAGLWRWKTHAPRLDELRRKDLTA